MKNKYWLMAALLLVFSLNACTLLDSTADTVPAKKVQPAPAQEGYSTYTEEVVHNISIQYPNDWEMQEQANGTIVQFFSPVNGEADTFRENVNVVSESLRGGSYTVDQYTELNREQLILAIDNYTELEAVDVNLGGVPAKRVIYTGAIDGLSIKWVQWYLVSKTDGYVITYTGDPQSDFDQFYPAGDIMAQSFRIAE